MAEIKTQGPGDPQSDGGFDLVNEEKAAAILQVSVSTLQKDRSRGNLVPYVKLGRTVRYRISDLRDVITINVRGGGHKCA
jgi:hypothetical protein